MLLEPHPCGIIIITRLGLGKRQTNQEKAARTFLLPELNSFTSLFLRFFLLSAISVTQKGKQPESQPSSQQEQKLLQFLAKSPQEHSLSLVCSQTSVLFLQLHALCLSLDAPKFLWPELAFGILKYFPAGSQARVENDDALVRRLGKRSSTATAPRNSSSSSLNRRTAG